MVHYLVVIAIQWKSVLAIHLTDFSSIIHMRIIMAQMNLSMQHLTVMHYQIMIR